MDEKIFDANNDLVEKDKALEEDRKSEEKETQGTTAVLEENDGWKFDAEAPTLNDSVVSNDEFEIQIPASNPYETAPRPTKSASAVQVQEKKPSQGKNEKVLFAAISVVMAVLLAVSAFFGVMYYTRPNSDEKMNPGNVAMTVGETPVSIGMYNYYYTCISQNYINYASYGYYDINTSKPYDEQNTTDDDGTELTWAQKFENDTINQIQYITAYYEEAVANGVKLTDTQIENVKQSLDGIKSTAADSGKSVNEYIAEIYGEHCGYATLEKMLEQCYIAENYYQQKQFSFEITAEQEQEYFNEHKEDYENVSFAYLQIPYQEGEEKEALDKANKYAGEIATVDDMKKLVPVACEDLISLYVAQGYAQTADECAQMLAANIEVSISADEAGFIDEAIDWLFSEKTAVGSCSAFDDSANSTVYILLKTSEPAADESVVYAVRHVLIMPKAEESEDSQSSDGATKEFTQEQWDEAEKKANEILDEFNSTEKTEDDFAALAEKYSEDTESTSKGSSGIYGGLYEGVKLGQMVPSFENWSIDAARKYGDVEIVKSDYGFHIMFFVENTKQYLYECKQSIRTEMEDEFIKSAEIKKHKAAMKKVKVAQPTSSQTDDTAAND